MPTEPAACIGVFDSGVGGLSVLSALRRALPGAPVCYLADSGYAPYGPRPAHVIQRRCVQIADALVARGARLLVVACNTATAGAADVLRAHLWIPVVGMEPAAKPAAAATRNGIVGVLATDGTLASARFAALLDRFAADVEVHMLPCPDLVDLVERGILDGPEARRRVAGRVSALRARRADTLVLGCTHFPLLRPLIVTAAGPDCALIDTASAVARQAARLLPANLPSDGGLHLFSSGDPAPLRAVSGQLLGVAPAVAAWSPDAGRGSRSRWNNR